MGEDSIVGEKINFSLYSKIVRANNPVKGFGEASYLMVLKISSVRYANIEPFSIGTKQIDIFFTVSDELRL